ncbi:MAG: ABC-F family ATP-binding cassette domain-containing protein, partial [Tissierellia bacterium]|nr:ABC-F family ATP-binding cassette domain-containing protein [Tissierellia bacterium]
MLVIKNLELYMKKDLRLLLKDFNFSLISGDKVALIGEEGNGKSTLLKAIYDESLIEDYIEIKGEIFKQKEIIGYLPQKLKENILDIRVKDFLMENEDTFDYNLFYDLLRELNIEEELAYRENNIRECSGGEKIKIQLLNLMLKNPTVLLLDEPSNDLDMESIISLEKFIKNAKIPIIFVSHDEVLIENCANTIIHIEQLVRKSEPKYTISRQKYQQYLKIRDNQISATERIANKEREELDKKMDKYRKIYDKVERAQREVSRQDPNVGKNLKDKMHTVKSMGKRFEKEEENLTKRPDFEESISIKFNKENILPNGK